MHPLTHKLKNFHQIYLRHYKLDPKNHYTSPGWGHDALTKHNGTELQFLSDYDKDIVEKSL